MEQPNCKYCGNPLRVVETEGNPDLTDWHCEVATCERRDINQGPRFRGKKYRESTSYSDGRVDVYQCGMDKDSQGENNVPRIAKAIETWVGASCVQKRQEPSDVPDDGVDAYLDRTDGTKHIIQVTRAMDREFCSRVASNPDATQTVSLEQLFNRVIRAIEAKTNKWKKSHGNPRNAILAIDVAEIGYFVWHELSNPGRRDNLRHKATEAGWFDVVLVGGCYVRGPNGTNNLVSNCLSLLGNLPER